MKKIIKGKLYDTGKAKELGRWTPNPYGNDFNYHQETLYLKRTGEFFIHEERYGSDKIRPLTYEETQKWAEEHLDGDDYIEIFGDPEEADKKQVISVSITDATYRKLKEIAAETGKPMGEIIDNLIK